MDSENVGGLVKMRVTTVKNLSEPEFGNFKISSRRNRIDV